MAQEIYIIDDNNELKTIIDEMLKNEKEYKLKKVVTSNIDDALKNIPSLIIINEDSVEENIIEILCITCKIAFILCFAIEYIYFMDYNVCFIKMVCTYTSGYCTTHKLCIFG